MEAPGALNLFGGFPDHLGPADASGLLGLGSGAEFALHGLSQEQKDFFRQYTVEQDAQARQALHAFEAACSQQQSAIGTPTHGGLLSSSQSLSTAPQALPQASNASQAGFASHSVPHTPLKQFDSSMAGLSALSTPTISTGSLSLGGAGPALHHAATGMDASAGLHSGSPMTPRHLLASAEQMGLLGLSSSSLLSVHAPPPGQGGSGPSAQPPPPPPSTPNAMMGMAGGPAAAGGPVAAGAGGSGGPQQGQLTVAFASALAQAATERGLDPGTLVQLLQNPKLVDVLLTKAGDLQQQAQQQSAPGQQQGAGMSMLGQVPPPPPPPPPPPKPPALQSRMSAPVPGEWPHHGGPGAAGVPHFRPPPPPPPPRPSPAATAAAQAAAAASSFGGAPPPPPPGGSSGGASGSSAGGGTGTGMGGGAASGNSSGSLDNVSSMQQVLSGTMVQEFVAHRTGLLQLMLSAYSFLNSETMRDFYDKLLPVAMLYDEMHELPVVQKRKRCMEMSYLRMQLMQDQAFTQILQAVCSLRHHLYSLSRRVLVINQGPEGIPIDLLLGSMSTELFHVMKAVLPQEICDFFGNCLPHPRLAVLVFAEFTTVDPMPTLS